MPQIEIASAGPAARLCSAVALLLGAFACGDGGNMAPSATTASATSAARASESPSSGATSSPSADATPPAAPADSPPPTPAPSGPGSEATPTPTLPGAAPNAPAAPAASPPEPTTPEPTTPVTDPTTPLPEITRESATGPGPFEVTSLTTGLRDGPAYGSQTLYVPEGAEPPLAGVVIVPGFNTPESSIQAWGPFLASHGIVALTIGTNSPADSAEARASALLDALETLKAENARAGSPLEGELSVERLGVMGWSLGGGGVLIASSSTPALKAAITMAAFGPGARFPNDQVPTLFLAGSADPNAGGQSQGIFASLPASTPRLLFEVRGGPHEIGNDPQNAEGQIGLFGLAWLQVFLVGDERFRPLLLEQPAQASDFQQNLVSAP